jgi:hypothetical protein
MKFAILFVFMLLPMTLCAAEWSPPEKPDVRAILNEAGDDARAGKYEQALAKHVWFHENAIKYERSMSGVRRSFALGDWYRLGELYPPAMEKLEEVRDATKKRIKGNERRVSFDDFHDLVALNRELGSEEDTVAMFHFVESRDKDDAERVFNISEPALIKAKEYALCGKYMKPEKSLRRILETYRRGREMADNPRFGEKLLDFHVNKFINDAATLVAILVVNDRETEASETAYELKKVEGDAKFHAKLAAALEEALAGTVPDPWP